MTRDNNSSVEENQGSFSLFSWAFWRRSVKSFFDNYTVVLSLLYLYSTGMGMVYSSLIYSEFGINILDYSEISDFLLAALKNPFVPLFVGIQLFTLYFFATVTRPSMEDMWRRGRIWGVFGWYFILAGFYLVLTIVIVYVGARYETQAIKEPSGQPSVEVRYRSYSDSADQVTKPGLKLIGSTQRVVFFYDVNVKDNEKDNQTLVIPQAQIVSIEVRDRR